MAQILILFLEEMLQANLTIVLFVGRFSTTTFRLTYSSLPDSVHHNRLALREIRVTDSLFQCVNPAKLACKNKEIFCI